MFWLKMCSNFISKSFSMTLVSISGILISRHTHSDSECYTTCVNDNIFQFTTTIKWQSVSIQLICMETERHSNEILNISFELLPDIRINTVTHTHIPSISYLLIEQHCSIIEIITSSKIVSIGSDTNFVFNWAIHPLKNGETFNTNWKFQWHNL